MSEDEGTLEVCVDVSGERERDFSVTLTTRGGTARGGLLSVANYFITCECTVFKPCNRMGRF